MGVLQQRLNLPLLNRPAEPDDRDVITEALIASLGDGLIVVNEYGIITHINQVALDILGFRRRELEGTWLPKTIKALTKDRQEIATAERPSVRALLTGKPVTEIVNYVRKDGSLVPVSGTAAPLMIKGKPRGAIIVFRDVSKEVQIEKAKDEFVSIASHQLRTPLTSVRLFAELLEDKVSGKLNRTQKKYVDKILFSTEKMIDLVSDLLNISRLDLGQLEIKPKPTNLNQLLATRIEEIKPVADAAEVELIFKTSLKDSEEVPVDRNLLAQVVHNLLTNAIAYSPPKTGRVEATLKKSRSSYEILVSDNGIGIPKEARHRIFERFFRADNAIKAQSEGTGLGLYLVKVIMESSGGRVACKSHENKGTRFLISIPAGGMKAMG